MLSNLERQKAPIYQPTTRRTDSVVSSTIVEPVKVTTPSIPLPPTQFEGSSFTRFNI